jgi:Leucine-rich repeat (LRR) protein
LENYQYLRYVNLNGNKLNSIAKVKTLPYLYELHANTNEIGDLDCITDKSTPLNYLQAVDLSKNKLKVLP